MQSDLGCVRAIIIRDDKMLLIKRNKFGELYYTLPGGHIEAGESKVAAVKREIFEETSLRVTTTKEVFYEPAANGFQAQYIFVCEVDSGQISLRSDSDEAKLNAAGKNTYHPGWYDIQSVPSLPFRTTKLASAIMSALEEGWPDYVVELTSS